VTPDQARHAIKDVLGEIAPDADVDALAPDADLRDSLELDSLDFLSFVEELGKRAGRRIDEDDCRFVALRPAGTGSTGRGLAGTPGPGRWASGIRADAGERLKWRFVTRFWGLVMNIAYYHASKFGNGAMVAEEFRKIMAARGIVVSVQHVRDANPKDLPRTDLYVFSSPGRMGKPKGNARRFLRRVSLEPGTRYAILTTQGAPKPDKKTGKMPSQEELDRWERVIPIMNELLAAKGLTKVTEEAVLVNGIKGPLEEGWQKKVAAFADQIMSSPHIQAPGRSR
jgi:acyl carrier protein/flavodoxin